MLQLRRRFFFQNIGNFMYIAKMQSNFLKMRMVLKITPFDIKSLISVNYDTNASERLSPC